MPYVQYVSMHLLVEIRFSLWTVDLIMKLTCNLQLATCNPPKKLYDPGTFYFGFWFFGIQNSKKYLNFTLPSRLLVPFPFPAKAN